MTTTDPPRTEGERAWMEEAREELRTLGMEPGFVTHYPITAEQYRALAARCPLPEGDDDEPTIDRL